MSEQTEKHFDVIICGAGPAGATCALALADSGLKIAVIEKSLFPRDKICGDAVAAYVPKVLNTLHPKYKDAINGFERKVSVDTCRVVAPNKKIIDLTFSEHGFISTRMDFDNFLFELAAAEKNITFFLEHTIKEVSIDETKGEVSVFANDTLFKAKIAVGCDGAQSLISKKLTENKQDPDHTSAAVRAYFKNVKGIPAKTFELHFMKNLPGGYFWIFPIRENRANVGVGVLSSVISKNKMNLRELMKDIIEDDPTVKERFADAEMIGKIEGFGLPLGSRKITISGNRFMLCGDAAALIDPITGEGIGQAMISGRYAGWQIKKCFMENNFSAPFMKQYDKAVYDKLWSSHRKSRLFRKLILNRDWLF
ncbi:MAG: geranylgeranyl reductase family protein, partial [Bacteroidia bacterium]|nr:geranylgeranyl reductase family protein [Bacteroidia bacterium]